MISRKYWKLKEEALGCNLWKTCFRRDYRPVIRVTTERTEVLIMLLKYNMKDIMKTIVNS